MEEKDKLIAIQLSEDGSLEELYRLLRPYIDKDDVYALHLFADFSLSSFNESEEEFAERRIRLKTLASENGIAEASYRMGVNHLYGDDVQQSYDEASKYFERAIEQGHSYTKFTYGYSLYYGTQGVSKDEQRGFRLIQEAAKEGIPEAKKEIKLIENGNA